MEYLLNPLPQSHSDSKLTNKNPNSHYIVSSPYYFIVSLSPIFPLPIQPSTVMPSAHHHSSLLWLWVMTSLFESMWFPICGHHNSPVAMPQSSSIAIAIAFFTAIPSSLPKPNCRQLSSKGIEAGLFFKTYLMSFIDARALLVL